MQSNQKQPILAHLYKKWARLCAVELCTDSLPETHAAKRAEMNCGYAGASQRRKKETRDIEQ